VVDPAKRAGASSIVATITKLVRAAQEAPVSTWKKPSIADALKFTGVASGVIYAGLFLSYRKYYSFLGVRPEDVGVNNTFILVRSIGFIFLVAVGAGLAILLTGWFNLAMDGPSSRHQAIHIFAVWCKFVLIISAVALLVDYTSLWLPALMAGVLGIACIAMARFSYNSRLDRSITIAGLVVATIMIILVPVTMAIISAFTRAKSVQEGKVTTPATILGIPLLDVSADDVHVSWICQNPQPPAIFSQSQHKTQEGFLVGETSTSYYVRLSDQSQKPTKINIVKLPQSCAFLTYEEPIKHR
jgi:hypothetical protein